MSWEQPVYTENKLLYLLCRDRDLSEPMVGVTGSTNSPSGLATPAHTRATLAHILWIVTMGLICWVCNTT